MMTLTLLCRFLGSVFCSVALQQQPEGSNRQTIGKYRAHTDKSEPRLLLGIQREQSEKLATQSEATIWILSSSLIM